MLSSKVLSKRDVIGVLSDKLVERPRGTIFKAKRSLLSSGLCPGAVFLIPVLGEE